MTSAAKQLKGLKIKIDKVIEKMNIERNKILEKRIELEKAEAKIYRSALVEIKEYQSELKNLSKTDN